MEREKWIKNAKASVLIGAFKLNVDVLNIHREDHLVKNM